ncbi:MAG TPA: CpsD/CapB family tyrosine-protein kinase, partial [Candidatus Mediterraneibacter excrementigallinarum]|nr:CpsD/CapB family tyrosine-protein kinase [Candidatus Mediterraneibacter excrementigallinarum]
EKERWKILTVTSVSENEGKSTVAANLAISLAEKDNKVLLIDGDLRRPSQFLIFGLHPKEENELGEFLKKEQKDADLLMRTKVPKLSVIGGRNCYSSSTDILQGDRTGKFLKRCKESVDYIIIDTPPTGVLGDAELWGQNSDAVLFVERQNFIEAEDINTMLDKFRAQETRIMGVVLNSVQSFGRLAGATVGRYSSRYGDYGNYGKKRKESKK